MIFNPDPIFEVSKIDISHILSHVTRIERSEVSYRLDKTPINVGTIIEV